MTHQRHHPPAEFRDTLHLLQHARLRLTTSAMLSPPGILIELLRSLKSRQPAGSLQVVGSSAYGWSAKFRAGCRARMDSELAEDSLGMMTSGVTADMQRLCDGGVGPALCQKHRNFELSPGEAVPLLQVCCSPLACAVQPTAGTLFLKVPSQLLQFPH
jgi:hypothetical protein